MLMLHSTLQQVAWLRGSRKTYFIKVKGIEPHCAGTNLFSSSNFIWTFIYLLHFIHFGQNCNNFVKCIDTINKFLPILFRGWGSENFKLMSNQRHRELKLNWHIFFPYFKNVTELKMKQLQYQIVEQLYVYISRN